MICLPRRADSPGQQLLPPARVTTCSEIFYGAFIKVSKTNVYSLKLFNEALAICVSLAFRVIFRSSMERCSVSHLLERVAWRRNK